MRTKKAPKKLSNLLRFKFDRDNGRATWGAYLKAADALAEGGL